jgi:hypothetical protein
VHLRPFVCLSNWPGVVHHCPGMVSPRAVATSVMALRPLLHREVRCQLSSIKTPMASCSNTDDIPTTPIRCMSRPAPCNQTGGSGILEALGDLKSAED